MTYARGCGGDMGLRPIAEAVAADGRTLHRFAAEELGCRRQVATVRVADCKPGQELQVDFGQLGTVVDVETNRRRVLWALLFVGVLAAHLCG